MTSGIVSTQARDSNATLSPCVDHVFYVQDPSWGGFVEGSERLSPTSEAMVAVSDHLVAIGGGEVSRDELIAARRAGKNTTLHPGGHESPHRAREGREEGTGAADRLPRRRRRRVRPRSARETLKPGASTHTAQHIRSAVLTSIPRFFGQLGD